MPRTTYPGDPKFPILRPCAWCGVPVTLTIHRDLERKKYCSPACRQRHRYAKNPWDMHKMQEMSEGCIKAPKVAKVCDICGHGYMPTSSRQRWCPSCVPDISARARFQRYQITEPQLQAWLVKQEGRCAICRTTITRASAHVDHRHSCCLATPTCGKCTRGLLCRECNRDIAPLERTDWRVKADNYIRDGA